MNGGRTLMSKPEGDDCDIDTRLKEVHGGGMTEGMGRYMPFFKGGESFCGLLHRQTQTIFNT